MSTDLRRRDWPPFNSTARCSKCGSADISALYREGWVYNVPKSDEGEWVQRTCRTCHYSWGEECISDGGVPLVPCPSRADAVLGFSEPTSMPCGLLEGHGGRHRYEISWDNEPAEGAR